MCNNQIIKGLDFTWEEINNSRKNNNILSIDLELSKACNLNCIYCYSKAGKKEVNELTLNELYFIIEEAQKAGARKIVIIGGGEPLLSPYYWRVVDRIRKLGLTSITFTNGTLINEKIARKLYSLGEDIALKFNSFDDDIQDKLAGGIAGTGIKIKKALNYLLEVGYSERDNSPKLALETIICRSNINEIEKIYKYCRRKRIIPYVEILTIQGNAKSHIKELEVTSEECLSIFKKLQTYDKVEYNIEWPLAPPIIGQNCKRMFYSAYITSTGNVQPCPGVDIAGGNIRRNSLKTIISESLIFSQVRKIDEYIKGHCKNCSQAIKNKCYGCRGTALNHVGDFLASDPSCWYVNGGNLT